MHSSYSQHPNPPRPGHSGFPLRRGGVMLHRLRDRIAYFSTPALIKAGGPKQCNSTPLASFLALRAARIA